MSWGLPFTRRADPAAAERDRLARDLAVARRALAEATAERDELRATVLRQANTIAELRTELSARRVGSLAARARAAHDATTAPHRTQETP